MAAAKKSTTITAKALLGVVNKEPVNPRSVLIMKDHMLEYPEIWLSVYVSGPIMDQRGFAEMLVRAQCSRCNRPEDADLVIFTGGDDVNPALYDETQHSSVSFNRQRDIDDFNLYVTCLDQGIPMFGVCRGAQFLHVMNGGKLYQDVDNHNGEHAMFLLREKILLKNVSSVHHQMCMPNPERGMEILATSSKSQKRWLNKTQVEEGSNRDIEAYFYRDTCCFGVQGHPEYRGYSQFTKWTLDMILDLIVYNPDFGWVKDEKTGLSTYRMKADILAQRKAKWEQIPEPTPNATPVRKKGTN